ncbi:MAG: twin-arginine translocase subunit TatC [Rectinemataceae bacterium]
MTYLEHLAELRKRLLISLTAFLIGTIACFGQARELAEFLTMPARDMRFVFLSPPDLFMTYVSLAVFGGFVLSLPVLLFELAMFVKPALEPRERRWIFLSFSGGAVLFLAGAAFGFFVIVPFTIRFFMSYQSEGIQAMISIREYFGFLGQIVLAFGLSFELPVVAMLLALFGILHTATLRSVRRVAILVIFIAAAILTPPDVVSQVLLALPMVGLFELSIRLVAAIERKKLAATQPAAQQN